MTHLTNDDLIDWMDGSIPPERRTHVEGCLACQARARELQAVAARALEADVPEPSPLFWDHLSSRIRDAVAAPEVAARRDRAWWPRRAWAAGLGAVAFSVAAMLSMPSRQQQTAPPFVSAGGVPADGSTASGESAGAAEDIEADEAWAVVRDVADRIAWDDTQDAAIAPRAGAAERMTLEMSAREQSALAELLQRELEGAGI